MPNHWHLVLYPKTDGDLGAFMHRLSNAHTRKVHAKTKTNGSGHPTANHIRDLKGTIEREQAAIGVYVTLENPTRPMETEAATAGFYEPEHFNGRYPGTVSKTGTLLRQWDVVRTSKWQGIPVFTPPLNSLFLPA